MKSEIRFAIQHEIADVTQCAQLLAFVRYVGNGEFLIYAALKATTKRDDIFETVNSFTKQHGLKWESMESYTYDGAPKMLGRRYLVIYFGYA